MRGIGKELGVFATFTGRNSGPGGRPGEGSAAQLRPRSPAVAPLGAERNEVNAGRGVRFRHPETESQSGRRQLLEVGGAGAAARGGHRRPPHRPYVNKQCWAGSPARPPEETESQVPAHWRSFAWLLEVGECHAKRAQRAGGRWRPESINGSCYPLQALGDTSPVPPSCVHKWRAYHLGAAARGRRRRACSWRDSAARWWVARFIARIALIAPR